MPAAVSKKFIGAVPDEWQLYSDTFADYTLGLPIGFGASSTVYAATYHPPLPATPVPCALKVLDLDSLPQHSLRLLQRETTLMSLSKHPNVLRVRGSWMHGHKLYIAMRLMKKGSAADVMKYAWPAGMEEEVVRCILKQALQGLNYLHINGFIHRDVKAANFLIDDDGTVLLGDLGVAASLADDADSVSPVHKSSSSSPTHNSSAAHSKRVVNFAVRPSIGKRRSFVGTPCWMSPELIQGHHYDSSSDIWSFGITALELCQGRPPRSKESPSKVLLKTVQDAPPVLDRHGGQFKYSKALQEVVQSCLVKDPSKRPTAGELLQTPFFKGAKKKSYLVGAILSNLPPLVSRQERRRQPSHPPHGTLDSWDFSHTSVTRPVSSLSLAGSTPNGSGKAIDSPTASIFMRRSLLVDEGVGEEEGGEEFGEETMTNSPTTHGPSPGSVDVKPSEGASKSRPISTGDLPRPLSVQGASKPVPMSRPQTSPPSSTPLPAPSPLSPSSGNRIWRKITRAEGDGAHTGDSDKEMNKEKRKSAIAIGHMFFRK